MDRGHALILETFDGPAMDALQTRQQRLAFWINTYNTLVVDGIVALGIRKSVWGVPEFFERISCRIDGLVFSAEEIEHGVLRGNRASPLSGRVPFAEDDPRMAHAIRPPMCASTSRSTAEPAPVLCSIATIPPFSTPNWTQPRARSSTTASGSRARGSRCR